MKNQNTNNIKLKTGLIIQEARNGKHMSPKKLLCELDEYGISLSMDALKSYETGRINIPSATLFVIAHILDLDLNSLKSAIGNELKKI